MASLLEDIFGTRTYRVEYFATEQDRKEYNPTREDFVNDLPAAEARAAALGKTLDWVRFYLVGVADEGTHIAAYGLDVPHDVKTVNYPRGRYACACGAWLRDDDELARHRALAGLADGTIGSI